MWINELSIDKKYNVEYDYIISRLDGIKNLSYTKENSKERFICSLATNLENENFVKSELQDIITKVILIYLKRRIVFSGIDVNCYLDVAYMASIIYFDINYEVNYLRSKMDNITDYNIDGILNFRLKKLKDNWLELRGFTADLLKFSTVEDLTYITSLMNSTYSGVSELKLEKTKGSIKLTTTQPELNIDILPIYSNDYYNILDAIIFSNPKNILLSNISLPKEMTTVLKKIIPVKYL